jgi:DNA-binding GntR family transcriptional regulator
MTLGAPIAWPGGRAEMLYLRFKQNIIDRLWSPDQPLNIDRLAAEYQVSITPVREALARLAADRLVVALPNKGYRVAPPPSPKRLADLAAVRLLVEPVAARGAAARMSERDRAELLELHERIGALHPSAKFEEIQAFTTLNRAFHERILNLNGNEVLAELYGQLGYHVAVGHLYHVSGIRDLPEVVAEHAVIVRAFADRDPAAAENAMRAHVENGSRRLHDAYGYGANPGRDP